MDNDDNDSQTAVSPEMSELAARSLLLLVTTAMLCAPRAVMASLGGDVTTVEADRVHMKSASVKSTQSALYSVHELQTPSGTTVREFADDNGIVFAVTWHGPFLPDLRQTLGAYFEAYQSAPRAKRYGHSHNIVEEPGLVVHSNGHMRSFSGIAYVPQLVPTGVSIGQLSSSSNQ
jgi:hypothetical protein